MMTKRLYIDPEDEMKEAFKVFDRDGDGYVCDFEFFDETTTFEWT